MGSKRIGLARVEALLENLKREIDWGAGSSFKGAVGSVASGYVDNTTAFVQDSDSIVTWTQPANSVLLNIYLVCKVVPVTAASADLGYEVGTTSSGGQIVTAITDQIIDAGADGSDLTVGAFVHVAGVGYTAAGSVVAALNRKTTSATTLAADVNYTGAARSLYFNTTCTDHAVTTAGTMRWIIEYINV